MATRPTIFVTQAGTDLRRSITLKQFPAQQAMSEISVDDHWIDSPQGRLFGRRWCPASAEQVSLPPIILLHDSLGCVVLWRDFPQRLAEITQRAVIAYDRLGYGQSDPYPHVQPFDFIHAEPQRSFAAVRQHFCLQRYSVFGHSVGGGMALACAAADPIGCEAVITEAAQAFVESRTLDGVRAATQAFAPPDQVDRLRKYHGDKATWVLSAWFDTWLSPDFADWNLDRVLPQIQSPLLVFHGDDDEYGSTAHAERIIAGCAGASSLRLLSPCGHVPHKQQAERVLSASSEWLRAASPQSGRE